MKKQSLDKIKKEISLKDYLKIVAIPFFLVFVGAFFILFNTYDNSKLLVEDQFNKQQKILINQVSLGIENNMDLLVKEIETFVENPSIKEMDLEKANGRIGSVFSRISILGVNDIGFLDSDGVLKKNISAPQIIGTNFSFRQYYQQSKVLKKSAPVYEFIEFKGVDAGEKGIIIASPIFNEVGKFNGVAVFTIKVSDLIKKFEPLGSLLGSFWSADESGHILYHGAYESGTGFEEMEGVDKSFGDFWEKIKLNKDYQGEYVNFEGDTVYGTSKSIEIAGVSIYIIVEVPAKTATALLFSFLSNNILITLIVLLLVVGFSLLAFYFVNKDIVKQLKLSNNELEIIAEKNIKAKNELRFYEEVVENMAEGVSVTGMDDFIIKYANPKFEEMFGYSQGEMVGKNVSIINAPSSKKSEEIAKEIMRVIQTKGGWSGEVNNIKKDGISFWCNVRVSTFDHSEYGKVAISVHNDITGKKKAEKELNNKMAELEKLNKLMVGREIKMREIKKSIKAERL